MSPFRFFQAQLQDALEFGRPIGPGLRAATHQTLGPSRHWFSRRFRRLRQKLHQRSGLRGPWKQEVSVESLRHSNQQDLAHGLAHFRELLDPQEVSIDPAHPFTPWLRTKYSSGVRFRSRQGFVCHLANPRLHVGEGLLVTREKAFLVDSAFAPYRWSTSLVYGTPVPQSVPFLAGTYSSIWGIFDSNIYHWLIDALPRLHSLEIATQKPLTLLMPDTASKYHLEALRLCLPGNMQIRQVKNASWVEVEEFIFPSYLTQAQCISLPASHVNPLRQRVWERLSLPPDCEGTEKIFISRRKAATRQILNEDEVTESLQKLGFKTYILEELSFCEQVRLFHRGHIVVAPHGAGLANVLFAPKIHVIELQSSPPLLHYFFLCQSLNHSYTGLLSPPRTSSNIVVSVSALKEVLVPLL